MSSIRVFVVAHQAIVRLGLAAMLAADAGFVLAGDAADGATAVRAAASLQPDLMLIDPHLPDMSATDLVQAAATAHAALGIAVLTDEPPSVEHANRLPVAPVAVGRIVAVSRNVAVGALASTLRRLHGSALQPPTDRVANGTGAPSGPASGKQTDDLDGLGGPLLLATDAHAGPANGYGANQVVAGAPHSVSSSTAAVPRNPLTQREQELLALMGLGLSNQQIAERLSIAMPTVKFHVTHILRKLGADNRTEAVLMALRHGLVQLR